MRIVPALDRGLQILEEVANSGEGLTVSTLAQRLTIPRSAAYELVHTLAERDMLEQRPGGHLALGIRVFALGSAFLSSVDLVHEAQDVAYEIMIETNETVQVGRLDGADVLYLAKVESRQMIRLVSAVGRRVPAHCTALGKMMLSLLERDVRAELIGEHPIALTNRSITDLLALEAELTATAERGWAMEIAESNPQVGCVAAPIWDSGNSNVAAMSISVPLARFGEDDQERLRQVVITGANRLSSRLGHVAKHDEQTDSAGRRDDRPRVSV
ncbi:IclR family transcriptional regulator [Conexibacter sp. S30A1]|uniref:IclR family transcriptional regulator n=1 Tax=Conexibacter sp. S30A1 TaxID=2937800 RepID=UPI002112D48E|nr:IclR family transcriptional regulator [Conexibacter sp. S30A1]